MLVFGSLLLIPAPIHIAKQAGKLLIEMNLENSGD